MEASAKFNPDSERQTMVLWETLPAIQANIRRYGWQSMVTRLTAFILGSVFILYSAFYVMKTSPASFRLWPVVCLFLLWILDGHFKSLQQKYVDLYHQVLEGAPSDMSVKVDDHFNVSALWRPLVMLPYVVLIALLALANFGF
jgi:hypothetical protein